jgi:hypothetical protein
MLVSSTEDTMLLLNASNSRIFMGGHHHVVYLLGIPEGEMGRVARTTRICAICDWVVITSWL